jgi:hypothetical protein
MQMKRRLCTLTPIAILLLLPSTVAAEAAAEGLPLDCIDVTPFPPSVEIDPSCLPRANVEGNTWNKTTPSPPVETVSESSEPF